MGFEGRLVAPHFHKHEMIRATVLLQHLKTRIASLLTARLTA